VGSNNNNDSENKSNISITSSNFSINNIINEAALFENFFTEFGFFEENGDGGGDTSYPHPKASLLIRQVNLVALLVIKEVRIIRLLTMKMRKPKWKKGTLKMMKM